MKRLIVRYFKQELRDDFIADIQDYSVISDEKANFIYDNCKEYLIHTVNIRQDLQKKVVLLLGFIFLLTSFLFTKIIDIADKASYPNFESDTSDRIVKFIIAMIICNLSIALILTLFGLYPKVEAVTGNEPRHLLKQDFVGQELKFMKIGEIIHYQESIDINVKNNSIIDRALKISIILLVVCPIVLSFIYFFGLRVFT